MPARDMASYLGSLNVAPDYNLRVLPEQCLGLSKTASRLPAALGNLDAAALVPGR